MSTEYHVGKITDKIRDMIIEKNRKYGDSALSPVRVFSKSPIDEQIRVRLDDKISRLQSGQLDDDEDVIMDLVGYLVLLLVHRDMKSVPNEPVNNINVYHGTVMVQGLEDGLRTT
jgi:hypothetical protein